MEKSEHGAKGSASTPVMRPVPKANFVHCGDRLNMFTVFNKQELCHPIAEFGRLNVGGQRHIWVGSRFANDIDGNQWETFLPRMVQDDFGTLVRVQQ
jgi:hypothetical protein